MAVNDAADDRHRGGGRPLASLTPAERARLVAIGHARLQRRREEQSREVDAARLCVQVEDANPLATPARSTRTRVRKAAKSPRKRWGRAATPLLVALAFLAGQAVGSAPSSAADLGSVTVNDVGGVLAFSPAEVTGAAGDTITVVNNSGVVIVPTLTGSTGTLRDGFNTCDVVEVPCRIANGAGKLYTVGSTGVITFQGLAGIPAGPLNIAAGGGGSGAVDLANPTYTATADANGGSCSGTMSWQKVKNSAAFNGVFKLPSTSQCTRTGFTLAGWALTAGASSAAFDPGAEYTMADADVTLFAVWRPTGVQLTYDANVGSGTECLAGGVNVTTAADRRSTSVVQPGSNTATTAPCTPVDSRLAGWAYTGNGSVAITAGQSLPGTLTSGATVTLFARWETVYGLSASPSSVKFRPGGSAVVTFTATVNGAPAPGRAVALSTSGDPVSISPGPSVGATTDAAGKVSVTIAKRFGGEATVTAAFGNSTATVDVSAVDSATIDITGERGTVAGKSGIIVNGTTTGFTAGDTVVPYVRFPGQEYVQGSARPEIAADGSFEWQRKTGKKTYVYFTSADGTLTSNRIIIAAQ